MFSIPNRAAAASDAGRCVAGHADEPDPGHLRELLECEQAETRRSRSPPTRCRRRPCHLDSPG